MKKIVLTKKSISGMVTIDEAGCWLWNGQISPEGYGRIGKEYVHRKSYEIHGGVIPHGFQVDHLCRVRACVNPAHLEAVTPRENVRRSESPFAKKAAQTHCSRGHAYTAENLIIRRSCRECRICRNATSLAGYYRRKAEFDGQRPSI